MSPSTESPHGPGTPGATDTDGATAADRLSPLLLDIVRDIPKAHVRRSAHPEGDARRLARRAAGKAALAAGALALPSGPLGWLTLLPELRSVWRIQVQLVADIAALYGRKSHLTQEQVLYCLFAHDGSVQQALHDLLVQVGGRVLVQPATARALKFVARKVAVRVAQRLLGQGAARWLPVAGAVGVGAYAWHETSRVATNAIALFAAEGVPAPQVEAAGDAGATPAGPNAPASNAPRLPRPGGR